MSEQPQQLLAGVIGDPVSHSRSPALHNAAFQQLGIAARYELWHTPAAELPARIASLRQPHMLGANVTLPHKVAVVPLIDRITPEAATIGAVNTIIREEDGSLSGANTDAPAFIASLREDANYDPAGQSIVVLGASGAARAAVVALLNAGAQRLIVANRTLERAEELLADLLSQIDRDPELFALSLNDEALPTLLAESSLIVNTTSLGWNAGETPLPATLIPSNTLVYDMVYRQTQLLTDAAARGAATLDGAGMFIRQAALAFALWTKQDPPIAIMTEAFR